MEITPQVMEDTRVLIVLLTFSFIFFNFSVDGSQFVRNAANQTESSEGIEARNSSNLFLMNGVPAPSDHNAHYAVYYTKSGNWHGTRGRISVWSIPNVNYNSYSSVYISVVNANDGYNVIVAGFHVYPRLYHGDKDLHFFTYWTRDNFKSTGCYNTDCPGYVVSNEPGTIYPGSKVQPVSSYDGKDYYVTLSIKKDETTGDWSLYRDEGKPILLGWWPKTILTGLADCGTVEWGGSVVYPKNELAPPMGSGHFPSEGEHKAAYISHIKLFDMDGRAVYMKEFSYKPFIDRKECYTTSSMEFDFEGLFIFYYGGPAGCKN